jgi:spore coat protein U-like protein
MKLTQLFLALSMVSIAVVASDSRSLAAGSKEATFQVKAAVVANCNIAAESIDFGNYDPLSTTATIANTTMTITCTKGANVSIGLSGGDNPSGSMNQMASITSGDKLQYQLYQDSTFATQWNDSSTGGGTGTLLTINPVSTMSPVPYTIFGRITAGQPVGVASDYTDTVTATVNF